MLTRSIAILYFVTPAYATQANLTLITGTEALGSKCLDGSPMGVYVRDTRPGNSWILQFDGGGWWYVGKLARLSLLGFVTHA